MNLHELRLNLKNYNAQLEVFRLENHLNQIHTKSLSEIEELATDSFSESTIKSLEDLSKNSDGQSEIERKGRRNLLNISRLGFLRRETKEIFQELKICQASVRVKLQTEVFTSGEAIKRIASEESAEKRSEIFAKLIDAQSSCANLLDEKFAKLQNSSRTLGFRNLQNLYEEIIQIDFEDFTGKAKNFLEKTEKTYFRMLANVAIEAGLETKKLNDADVYFLREKLERRQLFKNQNLSALYDRILENFGFNSRKITNIELVKTSEKPTETFCPNPPNQVKFCLSNQDGASNLVKFLRCFGRTNQAAWSSKRLAHRYPEFIFAPDDCLPAAFGILFQTLLTNKQFLGQSLDIWDEKLAAKIVEENKFRLLYEIRNNLLKFFPEVQIFGEDARNIEELAQNSAINFTNNLGFNFSKEQMLFGISENFNTQTRTRAFLFAYGLREYFVQKYDFQWWTSRRAFEELIDFWNTSNHFQAEEMARMIGFEMNFDLLAETL